LSDRVGRKPVLLSAALALLILTIPVFAILGQLSFLGVVVCQLILTTAVAAYNGVVNSAYAESLDARTRSGALSIGFNMGALIFGAPALYVMTLLNTSISAPWAPGVYVAVTAAISLVAVATLASRKEA